MCLHMARQNDLEWSQHLPAKTEKESLVCGSSFLLCQRKGRGSCTTLAKVIKDFLSFNSCSRFCFDRFDGHRCSEMTPPFVMMLSAATKQQGCPHTLHLTKCCFKHDLLCYFLPVRGVANIVCWLESMKLDCCLRQVHEEPINLTTRPVMSRGKKYLLSLDKSTPEGRLTHKAWACLQQSCHRPGNYQEEGRIPLPYSNPTAVFASAYIKASHQD